MKLILTLCLVMVVFANEANAQNPFKGQKKIIGTTIDNIEFTDYIKNTPTDQQFNKKFEVLEFWATWCVPCIQAMPHINELNTAFKDQTDLVFISVTDETPEKVNTFLKKTDLETIVVSDQNHSIHQKLRILYKGNMVIPRTVLIDNNNKIVWYGSPTDLNKELITKFLNGEKI